MTKHLLLGFILLFPVIAIIGCDSSTQNTDVQDIVELRWQSDGSAIFGFIQSYIQTATSATPAYAYSMARFNNDGSLSQIYNTGVFWRANDPATSEVEAYTPSLYVSQDGGVLVSQLENDLYRYTVKSGILEKLQTSFHLIIVSPDLHYAVGTPSPAVYPLKTVIIYDITASPIREVARMDYVWIETSTGSGIWLNGGRFGIDCHDTVGTHIAIYDTTGTLQQTIAGAEVAFHNVVYNSQTNDLFIRNRASASNDQSIDKINLSSMTRSNILNVKVENFDVTKDENIVVYSYYDSSQAIHLKSRNLQSGNEITIANDIRLIISLSPAEDKLAYIRQRDQYFNEIRVIPFTRP